MAKFVAPERVLDQKLYNMLLTLQQVKDECLKLYASYGKQGVTVYSEEVKSIREDLDNCIISLSMLASLKYDFDLQKGGVQ